MEICLILSPENRAFIHGTIRRVQDMNAANEISGKSLFVIVMHRETLMIGRRKRGCTVRSAIIICL
ncbi:hypothetical protein QQP08_023278 [Theobroma cacao]|nr:hypothetical protein QQP08_023278 [Theobroma cacao]